MPRFFASLRGRLTILVLLAVLPALGLTVYAYLEQRRLQRVHVQEQARLLNQVVTSYQHQLIESTRQLLTTLAQFPQVRGSDPAACKALLTNLLKQYQLYATLGVAKRNGDVFCSAVAAKGVNLWDHPWFQRAIKERNFAVGEYQIGRITRKPVLVFGYPVLDTADRAQSVVFASLDLAWLNQLVAQVKLPEGASLIVVDRNGTILTHQPDPEKWVGKLVPSEPIQGEGVAEVYDADGIPRLYAFTELSDSADANVDMVIGISLANPFAEANRTLIRNIAGLVLVAASAIAAVWVGGDLFLLRPVNKLVSSAKRIAAGDLSTRTDLPQGSGELSQLSLAFDNMAKSLEGQISDREQVEAEIRQLNQTLEQRVLERTAQLEAANKELDAFSYSVSHDLRAPLRHIKGFVDALALHLRRSGAIADPQVAHYIEVIQDSSQKMGQLIDGLLTLSRVGRQQLASVPVNLRQLVDAAISIVMSETQTSEDRPIEFTIGELPTPSGDPTLLQQVFTNLIDNAVKFSRVSVSDLAKPEALALAKEARHPAKIEIGSLPDGTIFVKDNGVGFQMEYADRLFKAFQRLHSPRKFKGTGIGLAIVQRIVHRHGGTIWVESQPNQGATFYFQLRSKEAA